MKIAENLYTKGFISYPRTETNIFPKDLDLPGLVQQQTVDQNWGGQNLCQFFMRLHFSALLLYLRCLCPHVKCYGKC